MQDFKPLPAPVPEYIACPRCDALHRKLDIWLALTLTALLLFIMANVCALAEFNLHGQITQVTLWGAVRQLWVNNNPWLMGMSACVTFTLVIVPILQSATLAWLFLPMRFVGLRKNKLFSISYKQQALRLLHHLQPWGMADVLLLSALLTFIKFSDIAPVKTGVALLALAALAILQSVLGMVGLPTISHVLNDVNKVVSGEGISTGPSTQYGMREAVSKSHKLQYVWALWLSAMWLYLPAMLLPMMHTRSFLSSSDSTLLEGVAHFWATGSWVLALLIVVASVCIPLLKLAVLGVLLLSVQRKIGQRSQQYIWLYQSIQILGRWSMLDIFVLMLTMALMHFYAFAEVTAGVGAVAFAGVVVLTLCATHAFDPRWIRQNASSHSFSQI